ncbi:FkbM family methyltransferase [Frigidibacter sp. RF13]|nr:FkbM family methyltransferase [Frigidibacter sp. RF13]
MRKAIRAAGDAGSEADILSSLTDLSRSHRIFAETRFEVADQIVAHQNDRAIAFPRPLHRENHRTILMGYVESIGAKYQEDGWCEVEPGDIVVDCGGYVGGFARSVVEIAERVIVIEPAPTNYDCCLTNLAGFDQALIVQAGLFDKTGTLPLQMSRRCVDHSLLSPDRGATGESIPVQTLRLDDLMGRVGITRLDFLKLEAEGAEIEVIEGMGAARPRKISIDAGPERYGQSPIADLTAMLTERGYETKARGHNLLAVLKS